MSLLVSVGVEKNLKIVVLVRVGVSSGVINCPISIVLIFGVIVLIDHDMKTVQCEFAGFSRC